MAAFQILRIDLIDRSKVDRTIINTCDSNIDQDVTIRVLDIAYPNRKWNGLLQQNNDTFIYTNGSYTYYVWLQ